MKNSGERYVALRKGFILKNMIIILISLISSTLLITGVIFDSNLIINFSLILFSFLLFSLLLYIIYYYYKINNIKWQLCEGNCVGKHCYVCNFDLDVLKKDLLFDRHDPCYLCDFEEECLDDPELIHTSNCEKYGKCQDWKKLNAGFEMLKKEFTAKSIKNTNKILKNAKRRIRDKTN